MSVVVGSVGGLSAVIEPIIQPTVMTTPSQTGSGPYVVVYVMVKVQTPMWALVVGVTVRVPPDNVMKLGRDD